MNSQKQKIFVRNENKAIKQLASCRLWASILTLTVALLFGKMVLGASIIEENFENYNIGDLNSQGDWFGTSTFGSAQVTSTQAFLGDNSAWIKSEDSLSWIIGNELETGNFSFYFLLTGYIAGANGESTTLSLRDSFDERIVYIRFNCKLGNCGVNEGKVEYFDSSYHDFGYPELNFWYNIQINWNADTNKIRYNFNNEGWTGWVNAYQNKSFTSLEKVELKGNDIQTGLTETFFDLFTRTTIFGQCGFGTLLRYCANQSDCESFNGYWIADFCWEVEPPAITTWTTYYATHSEFATPTSLITSMVNLTEPILISTGGWLVALESIFDVEEAGEKGDEFGEAIPVARSYLGSFNDFFGGFPISEAFIFFLIIAMAIGIFRIVRNIVALIKPL